MGVSGLSDKLIPDYAFLNEWQVTAYDTILYSFKHNPVVAYGRFLRAQSMIRSLPQCKNQMFIGFLIRFSIDQGKSRSSTIFSSLFDPQLA